MFNEPASAFEEKLNKKLVYLSLTAANKFMFFLSEFFKRSWKSTKAIKTIHRSLYKEGLQRNCNIHKGHTFT
jgi:hypothetical protein